MSQHQSHPGHSPVARRWALALAAGLTLLAFAQPAAGFDEPFQEALAPPANAEIWAPAPGGAPAPVVLSPAGNFYDNEFDTGAWSWQLLPAGLIYRSYLAGEKESRFGTVWLYEQDAGWLWDIALGGRVGLLRFGDHNEFHPQGWQLDIEGAGLPRLDLEHGRRDLVSADFRFGIPLTYGFGRYHMKFAYYHLSSHMGDEFIARTGAMRINYVRDALVWGHAYDLTDNLKVYGEVGFAYHYDGGAKPWEFQFGVEYAPGLPTGFQGAPFFAVNVHLRQENNYGGPFTAQLGWAWREAYAGRLFRVGLQYLNGMSPQLQFYKQSEQQIGLGMWYDF